MLLTCRYIKLGQTEPDLKIYRDSNNRDDFNRVVVNLETAEVSQWLLYFA